MYSYTTVARMKALRLSSSCLSFIIPLAVVAPDCQELPVSVTPCRSGVKLYSAARAPQRRSLVQVFPASRPRAEADPTIPFPRGFAFGGLDGSPAEGRRGSALSFEEF